MPDEATEPPGSAPVKTNVAVVRPVAAGGPEVIDVSGGVVSATVHVYGGASGPATLPASRPCTVNV